MCGISGIISRISSPDAPSRVRKMTAALAHRGPDGEGRWSNLNGTVHLGHRRLAILDTSEKGQQPFSYLNRYQIVHNGEIYNYIELRDQLIKQGYNFQTGTDTEVIIAAYDKYGSACLQQFDGMFAFAIWDEQEGNLFAARDRMGEKPFYYYWDENSVELLFGSEPKAIKAAGIALEKDPARELLFLGTGLTDPAHKGNTYYRKLMQLPAGHFLTYLPFEKSEGLRLHQWWSLEKEPERQESPEQLIKTLDQLLGDAIQKRMRSDLPVGTSLSGGIDSSTIAAMLHRLLPTHTASHFKTFTAGFTGFEKDESKKAADLAATLGWAHYIWEGTTGPTADELKQLLGQHEEPIGSASVWVQYKLYELARANGVSVLLDGQGADELFGGYTRYLHWYLQELLDSFRWRLFFREKNLLAKNYPSLQWGWKNIPAAFLSELTAQQLQEKARKKIEQHPYLSTEFIASYLNDTIIEKPIVHTLNDLLSYDCTSNGLPELLRYADRNSMAHGVEVRLPFLQHELVEWSFQLPATMKIKEGFTKWVLRKQASNFLPASIAWQKDKTGMEPPQKKWMQEASIQESIRHAREQLIQKGYAKKSLREAPLVPADAYDRNNFDWRSLVVAGL